MLFASLLLATLSASVASAHGNDFLSHRELEAHYARQEAARSCAAPLQARHASRMDRLHAKRSAILNERKNAKRQFGTLSVGPSTDYTATATATDKTLRIFPSVTSGSPPASTTTQASDGACVLTPQQESGPYYISGEKLRSNIMEDQPGVPFYLEYSVIDVRTCKPMKDAVVDMWNTNATGEYSGYISSDDPSNIDTTEINGNNQVGGYNDVGSRITDAETFLRGQQLTNSDGIAEFISLVPGWYAGRAPHIHLHVHSGGKLYPNGSYIGGTYIHTATTFFGEDLYSKFEGIYPYTDTHVYRTRNTQDRVWNTQNGTYATWNLYYVVDGDVTQGLIGFLNLAVDSQAVNQSGIPMPWLSAQYASESAAAASASAASASPTP